MGAQSDEWTDESKPEETWEMKTIAIFIYDNLLINLYFFRFSMNHKKTGTKTPQSQAIFSIRNNSGSKNPKFFSSAVESKRISPIGSFRMAPHNCTQSNSSLDKCIKQVKDKTKKMRRSLEKECGMNSKKVSMEKKIISSTITPKRYHPFAEQKGVVFKSQNKNLL